MSDSIQPAGADQLPAELFDVQTNIPLIHQVVTAQQAAARQGTHSTKTRGDVRGGGAKPWRQKGTGRARQGSRRAPQWNGGGVAHGPHPHLYLQRTPKKMIAAALRGVLSDRARDGQIFIIDAIVTGEKPSTKAALQALSAIGDINKTLVVLDRDEDVSWLSLRNAVEVHALAVDQLNTYDVVANDRVVFTKAALEVFVAGAPRGKSVKAVATESEAKAATLVDAPADTGTPEVEEMAEAAPAVEVVDYGEGSYVGANPPEGYPIKGNADSMKFHTEESPYYGRTNAEVWFNSVEAAEKAGFVSAQGDALYRGAEPPAGYAIKGNEDSMKFHTPESPYYERTIAEVWFKTVEAAEAAGYTSAQGDEGAEAEEAKK